MSYGAAHVMDMINRMKQNRAMRPSSRAKFKENSNSNSSTLEGEKPNFKVVSDKELEKIKIKIRAEAKVERRKLTVFYAIFIGISLFLIIGILVWTNL